MRGGLRQQGAFAPVAGIGSPKSQVWDLPGGLQAVGPQTRLGEFITG